MININGYEIQLILNDYEYSVTDIVIDSIVIYESVQLSLPTVVITGEVPEVKSVQFLTSDNIRGKLIITRILNNQDTQIVNIPIRMYKPTGVSNLQNNKLKLEFNYDWDFAYDASIRAFTGTSSSVFRTLGLLQGCTTTMISNSSDPMTWINYNQRGLAFLDSVCDAAWNSRSSCYQWGIRADNTLIFRDISRKNKGLLEKEIYLIKGDRNIVTSYAINSNIMTFNRSYGYGRTAVQYDYEKNTLTPLSTILLNPEGQLPTISRNVSQGSFRVPANYGNTHEHYQQALLQNKRIKSTYNNTVIIGFLNDNTNVQLLDDIVVVNNSDNFSVLNKMRGIVSKRMMVLAENSMRYTIEVETNAFNVGDL